LVAVRDAAANGLPVLLWEPGASDVEPRLALLERAALRDGADGRAVALYRALLDGGATVVIRPASLMHALARLGLRDVQNGSIPATVTLAEGSHSG
jgi:hypothetical protein